MNKRTIIIISSIIIIISLACVISISSLTNILQENYEKVNLEILQDSKDPRVDELITLSVININDDSNITWEIESIQYFGKEISISFAESKFYQINVTSHNSNEKGFGNLTLEVKNIDLYEGVENGIPMKHIFGGSTGYQSNLEVINGTTTPMANIHFEVISGIGDIGSEIWISNDNGLEVIESESVRIVNEGYIFDFNIDLSKINDIEKPYKVIANLFVYKGYITGFSFEFDIIY